jgi:hypothetical protein
LHSSILKTSSNLLPKIALGEFPINGTIGNSIQFFVPPSTPHKPSILYFDWAEYLYDGDFQALVNSWLHLYTRVFARRPLPLDLTPFSMVATVRTLLPTASIVANAFYLNKNGAQDT